MMSWCLNLAWDRLKMAYYTIDKRATADGTIRYRCSVSIKKDGKRVYNESKTFTKQAHTKTWDSKGKIELEQSGIPNPNDLNKITVGDLLKRYINDLNLGGNAGCIKRYVLDMLPDCDIAAPLKTAQPAMLSNTTVREMALALPLLTTV